MGVGRDTSTFDLVALGFAAALAQAVLLREAMSALGGSELAWGVVLAAWLAGMSLGALLGTRWPGRSWASPLAVLLLAAAGTVVLRAAPALLGRSHGEVVAVLQALWVWLVAVGPGAVAGGWGFATLAAWRRGDDVAAAAYGLESAGGIAGGLGFSLCLAPLGSLAALLVGLASTAVLVAGVRRRWLVAALVGAAFAVVAAPTERWLAAATWRWAGRPGTLGEVVHSRERRIEASAERPVTIYGDGRLLGTLPDPYRNAPRGHLLALLHPRPARVLLVGGLPGELEPYLLAHGVERLDRVVEDRGTLLLLRRVRPPGVETLAAGSRVPIRLGDPVLCVQQGGPWDLIILADGEPATWRDNRTRSLEFLQMAARRLAPGGILAMRVGVGDTYLGGTAGQLLAVLASTLRAALPEVRGLPGEDVWLLGARQPADLLVEEPVLAARLLARGISDPQMPPEMLPVLLDPERRAALDAFLASHPGARNTAAHPRAVLLAAALAEGRMGTHVLALLTGQEERLGRLLFLAALAAGATLIGGGWFRLAIGPALAALVGFASMGWWLLVLAAWQATRGSVYAEVGALMAAMMAGLATGAWIGRRWCRHARHLPGVLAVGAAVSVLLALDVATAWPRLVGVPLLLLAGVVTGMAFPGTAAMLGPGARGAGWGFAADEAGAAIGALLLGLIVLPAIGAAAAAWLLAGMLLAGVVALVVRGRRAAA